MRRPRLAPRAPRKAISRAPGEKQIGDVGAGDQQHETDGAEQQVQRAAHLLYRCLAQRHQRHGAQRTIAGHVAVGPFLGALGGEGVDLLLGNLDGDAIGEPAGYPHDVESHLFEVLGLVGLERQPHVDALSRQSLGRLELRTDDAGNHHGLTIDGNRLADDGGIGAPAPLPDTVPEHGNGGLAGELLAGEEAPEVGGGGEDGEELAGDACRIDLLGRAVAGDIDALVPHPGDGAEGIEAHQPLVVVGEVVGPLGKQNDPTRLGVRQAAQQHRIDDAEDGGGGADADGNDEDGGQRERRFLGEGARRVPEVLEQRGEHFEGLPGAARRPVAGGRRRRPAVGGATILPALTHGAEDEMTRCPGQQAQAGEHSATACLSIHVVEGVAGIGAVATAKVARQQAQHGAVQAHGGG